MEAKETVMNQTELEKGYEKEMDCYDVEYLIKRQAEKTWEMAEEHFTKMPRAQLEEELADKEFREMYRKALIDTDIEIFEGGKREGIREVVEWIKHCDNPVNISHIHIGRNNWQNQLKEWGINEPLIEEVKE